MNNSQETPTWKKMVKWITGTLVAAVVIDWLLDGRLRQQLPLRRNKDQQPPNQ